MPIISKPFLILGSLVGVSAAATAGYFGISALDSQLSQQIDSPKESSKDNVDTATLQTREQTSDVSDGAPKEQEGSEPKATDSVQQQSSQENPDSSSAGGSQTQLSGSDDSGTGRETS